VWLCVTVLRSNILSPSCVTCVCGNTSFAPNYTCLAIVTCTAR